MSLYCGREFSADDIQAIKRLIEHDPSLKRAPLSRQLCALWGWTKPNGELKDMTCRVALLRMQADGLLTLPPSQMLAPRRRPHFPPTAATAAQTPLLQPVHELAALTLRPITAAGASRRWNEYVALISFGASAWKLAGRDRFIGWQPSQRRKNLQLVVNNARFLILPWIQSKGLASKILALSARQLPHHWQQRYGYRPVLLETFVESARHRGTCYQAANWVHVGQTVGRGKKCPVHQQIVPIKDIWLYPLRRDFARVLCQ